MVILLSVGPSPHHLPTGTLTLLFSDIEGSTVLLHRLGDAWGDALSAQRAIMRAAIAEHGGVEMGTEGDSFFVVFESAHDAVAAAVAAQRGLHAHRWPGERALRVRMGLHTGEPQRHEDGYIGEDVHRAARIAATAHGGQVVVSESTRSLLPAVRGVRVRELGHHRLKDLPGPVPLYDLVIDGLPHDFPALRSLGRAAALPSEPGPLIGRAAESAQLQAFLLETGSRLVTLTGPGGAGKTRLALAVAAGADEAVADGVWFAGLAGAHSAEEMWRRLVDVLDAAAAGSTDAQAAVLDYLADRSALLVLDNLEQIPDADHAVSALLAGARGLRVLATSRRPLLLAGEREFPVEPLALPASDDPAEVTDAPAVALFVHHAQRVRPAFALTDENRAEVVALCRRLDGLPLALELAAAHLRLLTPRALLSRLTTTLGSGYTAGDRPDRQRTLGATIAWSYDLLDEQARAVFRRLGVFGAPADLDAVDAVAAEPDAGTDVLAVATGLVGTSLVRVEQGLDGEPRLALLHTVRDYARQELAASGEEPGIRLRHLRWCTDRASRACALLLGPQHTRGIDELALIEDDIRAALEFALRPGDDSPAAAERLDLGRRLLVDVSTRYWHRFGTGGEARRWQERGLALGGGGDGDAQFWLLHGFGMSLVQQSEHDPAAEVFERALEMARRLGSGRLIARALNDLAIADRVAGRTEQARGRLQEARQVAVESGATDMEAVTLGNLVVVSIELGDVAEAARIAQRSIEAGLAAGDEWGVAIDRLNYMSAILRSEDAETAHARYREWAPSILAFGDNELLLDLMELGACIAAGLGRARTAARLIGGADARRAEIPLWRSPADEALLTDWVLPSVEALSEADWAAGYAEGATLSPQDAVELLASLEPAARPAQG